METFNVHILGCGCALPTLKHNPSSQVVEIRGKFFMVDCGEGTQVQLRKTHIHFSKLQAVLISHMHGDHCFGLFGLISTFGLLGRTSPLHVYAPADYHDLFTRQLKYFCNSYDYEVVFHGIDTTKAGIIYEDRSLTIESIPLKHRMQCCGFLFREKPTLPHIRRDMIDFYGIPVSQINNVKNGADYVCEDGTVVDNSRLVVPSDKPRAYAYCSDTAYLPELHKQLEGVTTLYHEATYTSEYEDKAQKYNHSTAEQAAMVAQAAGAKTLLIGHYSSKYNDETVLLDEAKVIFPNTRLTDEGMVIAVE